jgi:hypothetical protein
MKISETHQRFVNRIDNKRILLHLWHPKNFLGPNWKDVLNFWLYLDTLSGEQLIMARRRFWNLDDADSVSSWELAWNSSCDVTNKLITNTVFDATRELIGAHKILEQGKSLTFVSLFLDL